MIILGSQTIVTENKHSNHSAYNHWKEQINTKHRYFTNMRQSIAQVQNTYQKP